MARAAERGGERRAMPLSLLPLVLLALPAAAARPPASFPSDVNGHSLHPPYFNLAEGTRISATATCGEEAAGAGSRRAVEDLYCKLVGGPVAGGDPNQTIQVRWGRRRGWSSRTHGRLAEPRRGCAGLRAPLCAPPVLGVAAGAARGWAGRAALRPVSHASPAASGTAAPPAAAGGSVLGGSGGSPGIPLPRPARSSGAGARTWLRLRPSLAGSCSVKRGSLVSRGVLFKVVRSFVFIKSRASRHPNSRWRSGKRCGKCDNDYLDVS